jgi:O-antigen ligase
MNMNCQTPIRALRAETTLGFFDAYLGCAIVLLLAASVAISSTIGVGIGDSWFDEQRIIGLVAFVVSALLCGVVQSSEGTATRGNWALLAALVIGLLSAALAVRPLVAAFDWSVYCLIAVLVLSARCPSHSVLAKTAALAGTIVPTAYVTGVVANYLSASMLGFPVGSETLLVGFSNPRFPAQLQTLTIPLLPLAFLLAPSRFWRSALALVAALWWMCLIGSSSRTAWIAVAAVTALVSFFGTEGRRSAQLQAVFALGGAILWVLFFHLLPSALSFNAVTETGRFSNFASVGSRWTLWRISLDYATGAPLLGIGPMHFAYENNGEGAHPHNFWLQLAAEWGLVAAVLVAATAVVFFTRLVGACRREVDTLKRPTGLSVLAVVGAWGIGTLADGFMVVPTSQAMSAAVLMLGAMWLREQGVTAESVGGGPMAVQSIVTKGLCVIALALVAVLPFTGFGQPGPREAAWRAEHPGAGMWPRFWQQGWIGPGDDPTARPRAPLR